MYVCMYVYVYIYIKQPYMGPAVTPLGKQADLDTFNAAASVATGLQGSHVPKLPRCYNGLAESLGDCARVYAACLRGVAFPRVSQYLSFGMRLNTSPGRKFRITCVLSNIHALAE